MTTKGHSRSIRTIKNPLIFVIGGFFIILGLMSTHEALASTIFTTDFEPPTYSTGLLNSQDGWYDGQNEATIVNTYQKHGTQSVYFDTNGSSGDIQKYGTPTCLGSMGFWFRVTNSNINNGQFFIWSGGDYNKMVFDIYVNYGGRNLARALYGGGWAVLGTYDLNLWYAMDIEWDCNTKRVRYRFNYGTWTDWVINHKNTASPPANIYFDLEGATDFYMDYIGESSEIATCSNAHCQLCETWATCQVNSNCLWSYSQQFCYTNEVGCGLGEPTEKCLFCDTQASCEGVEGCYWHDDFCYYSTAVCGSGDLELQFCLTQATCESAGGYWYEDYCWVEPKPAISSWSNWYASYGDYSSPAPLVNTLATSSQSFFESVGGFLTTFNRTFDLASAYQNGKNFGSAIPIARGYLATLNDFVGIFPIGTYFLFILMFMLAIGVFRMVRALIQLIKFW